MPYRVEFAKSAADELRGLERTIQRRTFRKIEALSAEPRPSSCRKLVGSDHSYRIRIGDHRVVYEIHDGQLLVLVVRVRHRREVFE